LREKEKGSCRGLFVRNTQRRINAKKGGKDGRERNVETNAGEAWNPWLAG